MNLFCPWKMERNW